MRKKMKKKKTSRKPSMKERVFYLLVAALLTAMSAWNNSCKSAAECSCNSCISEFVSETTACLLLILKH